MKKAVAVLALLFIAVSGAQAAGPVKNKETGQSCADEPASFFLLKAPLSSLEQKKNFLLSSPSQEIKPPPGSLRLEAADDLAALSFEGDGSFSPYVGAGITLGPLPGSDPSVDTTEMLAYGLGAGFGCNLDHSTRLNFGYQYHVFPDSSILDTELPDKDQEFHRISVGLQKNF